VSAPLVAEGQKRVYSLPLGLVAMDPSTQAPREEVGDGTEEVDGVLKGKEVLVVEYTEKNPESSGSSGVCVLAGMGLKVEKNPEKNPDSSGSSEVLVSVVSSSSSSSSGIPVSSSSSASEVDAGVEVRLDKGPVYGRDDTVVLGRPIPPSMVLVLASACEVDRLVL